MALKPNQNHKPALSEEQVLQIRELYYKEHESYSKLAKQFNTTKRVIQCAVQGIGQFYSGIQDDIPQDIKDNRMPGREFYSVKRTNIIHSTTNKDWTFMIGWSPERIARFKQQETKAYENAKKWGF